MCMALMSPCGLIAPKKRWLIVPNLAACDINHRSLDADSRLIDAGPPARQYAALIPTPRILTIPQLSRSCSKSFRTRK